MVGAFGMRIDRFPDNTNPSGPSNRLNDAGIDAQYQHLDPGDRHRLSAQVSYVREKQAWNATIQSNPSDVLRSLRAKATCYYSRVVVVLAPLSRPDSSDVMGKIRPHRYR